MRNESGFTLTELMIAIAIIAILTAFAVPKVTNFMPEHRLKKAALELKQHLHTARIAAIRFNFTNRVTFNTGTGDYQFIVNPGPDGAPGGGDDVVRSVTLSDYGNGITYYSAGATPREPLDVPGPATPGDGVSYGEGGGTNNAIEFNSRGLMENAGARGYVYLTNAEGAILAVGTPMLSGLPILRKWYASSNLWTEN